jgi:hypothetical protein
MPANPTTGASVSATVNSWSTSLGTYRFARSSGSHTHAALSGTLTSKLAVSRIASSRARSFCRSQGCNRSKNSQVGAKQRSPSASGTNLRHSIWFNYGRCIWTTIQLHARLFNISPWESDSDMECERIDSSPPLTTVANRFARQLCPFQLQAFEIQVLPMPPQSRSRMLLRTQRFQ